MQPINNLQKYQTELSSLETVLATSTDKNIQTLASARMQTLAKQIADLTAKSLPAAAASAAASTATAATSAAASAPVPTSNPTDKITEAFLKAFFHSSKYTKRYADQEVAKECIQAAYNELEEVTHLDLSKVQIVYIEKGKPETLPWIIRDVIAEYCPNLTSIDMPALIGKDSSDDNVNSSTYQLLPDAATFTGQRINPKRHVTKDSYDYRLVAQFNTKWDEKGLPEDTYRKLQLIKANQVIFETRLKGRWGD